MPRTQIKTGSAEPLVFYPPEGRPDADATLTVYTGGTGEAAGDTWPATVTLDAASTTLSALGSRGDMYLSLTDATGFVRGGRYWVVDNTTGHAFEVTARGAVTGRIYLDQPLPVGVAAGSAVAGLGLSYATNATLTGTSRRRMRAEWGYDVGGVSYTATQFFDIVEDPFRLHITEADVERHDHTFGEYAGSTDGWRSLIGGATDDIERRLFARQLYPDLIRDRDGLKDAVICSLLSKFFAASAGMLERAEYYAAKCSAIIEDVLTARAWYDADDDLVVDTGEDDDAGASELGIPVQYMRVG